MARGVRHLFTLEAPSTVLASRASEHNMLNEGTDRGFAFVVLWPGAAFVLLSAFSV